MPRFEFFGWWNRLRGRCTDCDGRRRGRGFFITGQRLFSSGGYLPSAQDAWRLARAGSGARRWLALRFFGRTQIQEHATQTKHAKHTGQHQRRGPGRNRGWFRRWNPVFQVVRRALHGGDRSVFFLFFFFLLVPSAISALASLEVFVGCR